MRFALSIIIGLMVICGGFVSAVADIPTSMNVQGRLTDSTGSPLPPGPKTFTFKIFNASAGGFELWPVVPGEVQIIETDALGLWNAQIGALIPIPEFIFTDTAQWLEITVNDGISPPETLPRVKLLTLPSAFQSVTSETAGIALMAGPNSVNSVAITDSAIAVEDIGRNGAAPGQVLKWNGTQWIASDDNTGGGVVADSDWVRSGDVLYSGAVWGLARAGATLRGFHDSTHINLGVASITGRNDVDCRYATVSGGYENKGGSEGSTVGGGSNNVAGGRYAVASGGKSDSAFGDFSTIAGGIENLAEGHYSVVGGGYRNYARGPSSTISGGGGITPADSNSARGSYSVIGGGRQNRSDSSDATVGGGSGNSATGDGSTVAGGIVNWADRANATVGGGRSNRSLGDDATVAGGHANDATNLGSSVGGGINNIASGQNSTIGGGWDNRADSELATVAGGGNNLASSLGATIGGGSGNVVGGERATVSGGAANSALGPFSAIGGGGWNYAHGRFSTIGGGGGDSPADTNSAKGQYAVIGGGWRNSTDVEYATVGGGGNNRAIGQGATVGGGGSNEASGGHSTVAGGNGNYASADQATVGGGNGNQASAQDATVSGGSANSARGGGSTVSGGGINFADGLFSTIGGGSYNFSSGRFSVIAGGGGNGMPALADTNTARGDWSMVPGGKGNAAAGHYSFAGGRRAIANHDGAFVWSDTSDSDFLSVKDNEFAINAGGGVRGEAINPDYGAQFQNLGDGDGVRAYANVSKGVNWGALYAYNLGSSPAVYAQAGTGDAGYFEGNVSITGTVSKGGGSFKIDHPIDPTNKYLSHSFVESPDMMNVYNGNITTDGNGIATVTLPDYFEALNRDFRYQLTVIGQFAQAIIGEKISGNQFTVRTDKPNVEVSWQVTGVRQDAFANAHRIPVEEMKPAAERGQYLHPREHGLQEPIGNILK